MISRSTVPVDKQKSRFVFIPTITIFVIMKIYWYGHACFLIETTKLLLVTQTNSLLIFAGTSDGISATRAPASERALTLLW